MKIKLFRENLINFEDYFIKKSDKDYNYLVNVLKIKDNDFVYLFSEKIEIKFNTKKDKNLLTFNPVEVIITNEDSEKIYDLIFLLPIIKIDKMNLIANQITQMSFGNIVLFKSQYSQPEERNYKKDKFFLNTKEALEQSDGFYFPKIFDKIIKIKEILNFLKEITNKDIIVFYGSFQKDSLNLNNFLEDFETFKDKNLKNINFKNIKFAVMIGPEGGFSKEEEDYFSLNRSYFIPVNLGNRKLRCETASVILMSLVEIFLKK